MSLSHELLNAPSLIEKPSHEDIRCKETVDQRPVLVSVMAIAAPTQTKDSSLPDMSSFHTRSEDRTRASTAVHYMNDSDHDPRGSLAIASTTAEVDGHHGREYRDDIVSPGRQQLEHQAPLERRKALPRSQSARPGPRDHRHDTPRDPKIRRSRSLRYSSKNAEYSVRGRDGPPAFDSASMIPTRSRPQRSRSRQCPCNESSSIEKCRHSGMISLTRPSRSSTCQGRKSSDHHNTSILRDNLKERPLRDLRDNQRTGMTSDPMRSKAGPWDPESRESRWTRTSSRDVRPPQWQIPTQRTKTSTHSTGTSATRPKAHSACGSIHENFPPVTAAAAWVPKLSQRTLRGRRINSAEPIVLRDDYYGRQPMTNLPAYVPPLVSIETDPALQFLWLPYQQTCAQAENSARGQQLLISEMESVCVLPCPRSIPTAGHQDWHTIKGMTYLDICPSCTNQIIQYKFGQFFIPSKPKPPEQNVRCSFSEPWVRLAWAQAIRKDSEDLRMLHQITRPPATTVKPCPGNMSTASKQQQWYRVTDPQTGAFLPRFSICQACVRNLRVLMLCGQDTFSRDSTPDVADNVCHLAMTSPRFLQYIDLLDAAAESSSMDGFLSYARRKVVLRECPRNRPVIRNTWRCIPQFPEFTVCEDCFDDVVWPLSKANYSIARMFRLLLQPTTRQQDDEDGPSSKLVESSSFSSTSSSSTAGLLIDADNYHHGHEATCHLYSAKIRAMFRQAVMNDDFENLQQAVLTAEYQVERRFRDGKKRETFDEERRHKRNISSCARMRRNGGSGNDCHIC